LTNHNQAVNPWSLFWRKINEKKNTSLCSCGKTDTKCVAKS